MDGMQQQMGRILGETKNDPNLEIQNLGSS